MRAITADLPPKEQKSPKHLPFRKRFHHLYFKNLLHLFQFYEFSLLDIEITA